MCTLPTSTNTSTKLENAKEDKIYGKFIDSITW